MPQIIELTAITGEDCMIARVVARSVEDLATVLDRLAVFGQTSTSIVLNTPIPLRNPIGVQQPQTEKPTSESIRVERRDPTRRGRASARK